MRCIHDGVCSCLRVTACDCVGMSCVMLKGGLCVCVVVGVGVGELLIVASVVNISLFMLSVFSGSFINTSSFIDKPFSAMPEKE